MESKPVLPIQQWIPTIKGHLEVNKLVVLEAPPGAGKSTYLPIQLLDEKWLDGKKILMLEPRRLAAKSVSLRMSQLLDDAIGNRVGYRIRFESNVSKHTQLEVVTEGILTRMIQTDNALDNVGLVIFDEFHERNLNADLALALCLQVQEILRPDLRLLIMSATLNAQELSKVFPHAPVVKCEGKQYPVKISYVGDLMVGEHYKLPQQMAVNILMALEKEQGDVLAFFPGVGEILRCMALLDKEETGAILCPLYGELNPSEQQKAILPDSKGRRKVVLATSIAETSLTIEGIGIVVDSGFSRLPKFDLKSSMTKLATVAVTKDAAEQRSGRAGRLGPGICYRLWSPATHNQLKPHRIPEIAEQDLSSLVLELYAWGIQSIQDLTWVTVPPAPSVRMAMGLLEDLGAIKENKITPKGRELLQLPCSPRLAHMIVDASDKTLATDIAGILEEKDCLDKAAGADLYLRLEALRHWRAGKQVNADRTILARIEKIAGQYRRLCHNVALDNVMPNETAIGYLLSLCYPERVAKRQNENEGRYRLANGKTVKLPPADALSRQPWLAIAHCDAGEREGKIYMAAGLDPLDLSLLATESQEVAWNIEREQVIGKTITQYKNLEIASTPLKLIPAALSEKAIKDAIKELGLAKMLDWTAKVVQLQNRILSLKIWRSNEQWPDVSDNALVATLDLWLSPYLINTTKLTDLKRLNVVEMVVGLVPYALQPQLDLLAPAQIEVPSGSMVLLSYSSFGNPPELAVRLQEIFGMLQTPTINEGRTKLLIHLLSPARRPVQVTMDLQSFWSTTYQEVRKELKIRYPKHAWPDDPFTAKAVKGVVRKFNTR